MLFLNTYYLISVDDCVYVHYFSVDLSHVFTATFYLFHIKIKKNNNEISILYITSQAT